MARRKSPSCPPPLVDSAAVVEAEVRAVAERVGGRVGGRPGIVAWGEGRERSERKEGKREREEDKVSLQLAKARLVRRDGSERYCDAVHALNALLKSILSESTSSLLPPKPPPPPSASFHFLRSLTFS